MWGNPMIRNNCEPDFMEIDKGLAEFSDTGCTPLCAESKKEPSLSDIMALQYILFRKRNRTDNERRFGVAVCCGHLKEAIELYNQIKGV